MFSDSFSSNSPFRKLWGSEALDLEEAQGDDKCVSHAFMWLLAKLPLSEGSGLGIVGYGT